MKTKPLFTYGASGASDAPVAPGIAELEVAPPDAVVVLITAEEAREVQVGRLEPQLAEALRLLVRTEQFRGLAHEVQAFPALGVIEAAHVIFAGWPGAGARPDDIREMAAAIAKAARRCQAVRLEVRLSEPQLGALADEGLTEMAQAFTEGLLLAVHDRQASKREQDGRFEWKAVQFKPDVATETAETVEATEAAEAMDAMQAAWMTGVRRGMATAEAVGLARDLTNQPGNRLTPEALAEAAEQLAQQYELEIEVIDEYTAAEQGMGGLLAVGQGSFHPPRMIMLYYKGDPDQDEMLGLIGKGITFDTGGISLKRAAGMEEMISDMAGAAAVLGAMQLIAVRKPKVNVLAVIAAAENMPSDRALKPGDVITSLSKRTIEIVNTDAEGRVVLADALTAAIRRGATTLVDVATLTGAVSVALGDYRTAAIGNNEALMKQVKEAAQRAGERLWELPADAYYRKQLASDAADLKNSGGREAGTITGALFIGEFAEKLPWVHLDIGGTAWLGKARGAEVKGATGVMTRTLAELACSMKQPQL